MFKSINPSIIISSHFKTFRRLNGNNKMMSPADFLLFACLPIFLAILLTYLNPEGLVIESSDLIKVIAIFGAFFFNLLALIFNIKDKIKNNAGDNPLKKKFADEIHANISFSILLSILLIVLISPSPLILTLNEWVVNIYLFLSHGFLIFYLITILLVLKKVFIILEIKEDK